MSTSLDPYQVEEMNQHQEAEEEEEEYEETPAGSDQEADSDDRRDDHFDQDGNPSAQPASKRQSLMLFGVSFVLVASLISAVWCISSYASSDNDFPSSARLLIAVTTPFMLTIDALTIYMIRTGSFENLYLQIGVGATAILDVVWIIGMVLASFEQFVFYPFAICLFDFLGCCFLTAGFVFYLVPTQQVELIV